MKQRFPQDLDYTIILDPTRAVTEGMKDILVTLLIALALVIVVVYVFLQDWRATLIPLLAVPVSLVGTFIVFPDARFFHQYALAFRIGSGHRPGGGRCHRGRRRCATPHRGRSFSQGCGV